MKLKACLSVKITFCEKICDKFLNKRQRGVTVVVSDGTPELSPAALVIVTKEDILQTPIIRDVGSVSWVQVEIRHVPEISN